MTTFSKKWSLQSVILMAIIAIFFGIIYQLWSFAYAAIAMTPLKPFANDLTLGVWLMAGPMAGVLLQRPFATLLGEILAAVVEMFLFSGWGAAVLISGFIQGSGNELGFALTGYKNWTKLGLFLSTISATVVTFGWDLISSGYANYSLDMLVLLFLIRLCSIGFFSGVLVYAILISINKNKLTDEN